MSRLTLAVALVAIAASPAYAHKPSDAHLGLAVAGDTVTGRLDIAVRDLDAALVIDADGDGSITWAEVTAAMPQIEHYVTSRIAIASGDRVCTLALGTAGIAELSDGAYVAIPIDASCPEHPRSLAVTYRLLFDIDAQHRGLVHLDGQTVIVRDGNPVTIEIGGETSLGSFVAEGVWHIWIGFDHILFLVCLILPAVFRRDSLRSVAREVFEIVTAFTLAHSITLVVSAVGLVQLPTRIVETAIALSVVAAALNNLVRLIDARWAVAFALGLLHGFGFSSVLIDLGLPSREMVGALLGFNLGVEIGQAAIVIALVPLLYAMRRTLAYRVVLWGGSAVAAVIAAVWTFERWFA
jgi:hypothetical protein